MERCVDNFNSISNWINFPHTKSITYVSNVSIIFQVTENETIYLDELSDLVGGLLDLGVVSLATRGVGVPQPQAWG